MRNIRLLWHIFPAILLITLAAMGLVTWYGTSAIKTFYYQQMTEDIEARAQLLQPEINRLLEQSPEKLQPFCRRVGRKATTRITVMASDGLVLADSNEDPAKMDNHNNRPEIQAGMSGQVGSSIRFSKTLGHNRLYVALPASENELGQKTVLRLSLPVTAIEEALGKIYQKIIIGIIGVILFSTLIAYCVARGISFPLETLQKKAEKLANGTLMHPFNVSDFRVSSEMAGLATSFNSMATEVQAKIHTISRKNNELEAVFSSMSDPVIAIDSEEQIIRINRAAATLFNLDLQKVTGLSFSGLVRNQEIQELAALVLKHNETVQEEVTIFEGIKQKQLRTRMTPLLDATGNSIGALIVMTDMTRTYRLENMRRDFAANVSHELKTPITSIKGYVETLLDGALDEKKDAHRFLEIVSRQTNRLDAIIDDLLTLSRIEDNTKKDTIDLNRQEICPTLAAAQQTCAVAASDKNVTVDLHCPGGLKAMTNLPLLEQAVINLLTNAITYSPVGSTVILRAVSPADTIEKKTVRISVEDQGPGIGAEHLDRIFERFYRCDKARSRENGGTGLGLAIVKHIVQCHGGTVEVKSKPGQGAVFILSLQG